MVLLDEVQHVYLCNMSGKSVGANVEFFTDTLLHGVGLNAPVIQRY